MSLKESFRESVKKNLGSAAIIFPPTSKVQLGDYGFYNQGDFFVVGNLFVKSGTHVNDFINDKIEESPAFNYLINNKEATSLPIEIKGEVNELVGVDVEYSFNSESGFLAHLTNTRTGSIYLNDDLKNILKSLKNDGSWKNSYKFVWQIWETELKFAFAQSKESKVVLSAKVSQEVSQIADLKFDFNFIKSRATNGEFWSKEGVKSTPIANFARYNMFGSVKPQFTNKMSVSDTKPFQEDTIIPDNSWE